MFSGIRWRLISYYLLVIAVIVILMGAIFIWFLNYYYMQTLRENLYIQARLAASLIEEMIDNDVLPEEIDQKSKILGRELGLRLTLIDRDGVVLADSAEDPGLMDNHQDRPEIIEALQQSKGVAVRYSVTLDEEMFYLAIPFKTDQRAVESGHFPAVVRLALPLASINQAISNLKLFIIGALFIASLVALAASILLAQRITGPVRQINRASRAIAAGDYTPPLDVKGRDELASLAGSIKEMGLALRKKINQVLWEKKKLETVVSSMSLGIILVDRDLKIELVNPAAEELFDITNEETEGKDLQFAIRCYSLSESLKAVNSDGQSRLIELNLYYPRTAVLEAHILPVKDINQKVIGLLLLFHELTHLRSLEKMRSDFVANVSHELRTPLTAVRGYTETILHEELSHQELRDFLLIIERETKRLSSLLDDLLDLAQIENEKGFIKMDKVDLTRLIDEALQRVRDLQKSRKVNISFESPAESLYIKGKKEWLRQALVNILENSIRHGRDEGEIKVGLVDDGDNTIVEISDNGPGIPEPDLPYVFERFYRVDKARSRKSGGTGLGLSIVKHILEAHGADYTLESKEGEGTLFRLILSQDLT